MICSVHQVEMPLAKRERGWPVHRCPECLAEHRSRLVAVKKLWAKHSRRHMKVNDVPSPARG